MGSKEIPLRKRKCIYGQQRRDWRIHEKKRREEYIKKGYEKNVLVEVGSFGVKGNKDQENLQIKVFPDMEEGRGIAYSVSLCYNIYYYREKV